jgi:hypothetical protein
MTDIVRQALAPIVEMAKAFSGEGDSGSRQENASNPGDLAAVPVVSGEALYPPFGDQRRFP